ncbi:MAG TPA: FAD-dependent oxidoreductase, partial [Solirubrobacteraceae bacterium]
VLLGFLEGDYARRAGLQSEAERRGAVLDVFGRLFGDRARRPERYIEKSWAEEEFTRGCYGCYMTPGGWTSFGEALRRPVGPVHWAGAETATIWNGYMDGAVRSGERAAKEVLEA